MGGIMFVSTGSGGERILSNAYANFRNLRSRENHFFAINTSMKDHERVRTEFIRKRISQRTKEDLLAPNFHIHTMGEEDLGGYGAGKDRNLGLEAYKTDKTKIIDRIAQLHKQEKFKIAFTIATLGGGCGSLTLAELSRDIRDELGLRVVPICTFPFRREGELLIGNAKEGLSKISKVGLNPIIYDNERMIRFSDSVNEGVELVNKNIALLISNLVDLVEYGGFATPPIDIIDITRLITPQCGTFSMIYEDNVKKFKKEWQHLLNFNLSLESETIENAKAFVLFKSKAFPHTMTENVISYLRTKYKVTELIPSTMEDGFVGYTIMIIIWGLGLDDVKPRLEPKKTLLEKVFRR